MPERVMIVGKGAREHALAYRLSKNAHNMKVREVLVTPGNDGITHSFPCLKPNSSALEDMVDLARKCKPDLIVIGPEDLLAAGLSDALVAEGFAVFGPSMKAAQIESSKAFMKELATHANIPTAAYSTFDELSEALAYISSSRFPLVVKADGLSAGKGVVVAQNEPEAIAAAQTLMAMGPIVIEEFLPGFEMSVIALCDGENTLLFSPVRDHKRLLDGDNGPNTGGMGVVGPLACARDQAFMRRLKDEFFLPTLRYMVEAKGCPFRGALFAGLMVHGDDIRLLEFNARFGDPETQALMYGTQVDLYPLLLAVARGQSLTQFDENMLRNMVPTASITVAAYGYPNNPKCGDPIKFQENSSGTIFMAGVSRNAAGQLTTGGGRVLSCTASAGTMMAAIQKSYEIVSSVSFNGAQYRTDIGKSVL